MLSRKEVSLLMYQLFGKGRREREEEKGERERRGERERERVVQGPETV
jgi:hypothetical protein